LHTSLRLSCATPPKFAIIDVVDVHLASTTPQNNAHIRESDTECVPSYHSGDPDLGFPLSTRSE
jgi:hypothetical protein